MGVIRILPTFLLGPFTEFIALVTSDMGIGISLLGLKPRLFGSCMITSVGMFGVEEAFAPFTHFTRVPFVLLVGATTDKVVVIDGKIVVRPIVNIMATVDHRYVDGQDGARVIKLTQEILHDPQKFLGDT